MAKIAIIAAGIIIILLCGMIIIFNMSGPDLKKYESLNEPGITEIPDQKMIETELKGVPGNISGKAIGVLYQTFYKLKNNRIKNAAPRARWPVDQNIKQEEWIGIFGLPVSDEVYELPEQKGGFTVKINVWKYGTVVEILHIGSYSSEKPSIDKLVQFIKDNGYRIIGDHEEEYLKGPGLFPVNPNDYHTVIRYRVKKIAKE